MTQAFNLAQLANNLNTSGQLDATDGLSGLVTNANLASSGTASSSTFLRGDRSWATVTQRIVQVVSTTKTDFFSWSGGTTFTAITGLSVAITPASTSNKIFVFGNVYVSNSAAGTYGFGAAIYRNGSVLTGAIGNASGSVLRATGSTFNTYNSSVTPISFAYLDSPASTSAQTYQIYGVGEPGGTIYVNTPGNTANGDGRSSTSISTITAIEVLA